MLCVKKKKKKKKKKLLITKKSTCPGTLRVYVAAILACHALNGGVSVGRHPLVVRSILNHTSGHS